jgi:ABC-type transport system substrate-binding protein
MPMPGALDRRTFLRRTATVGVALMGAPLVTSSRASAAGDRLVVAVGQWALILRDVKTWEYRPGLATTFQPSNEMKTWTFKLRPGVKFHEGWGELSAEDVKFTLEQSFKPDSLGGSAYFFRNHLEHVSAAG